MNINWIVIDPNDYDTYPDEGIEVLVTNGNKYDVAWYLMSSEYKWVKTNHTEDRLDDFDQFEITKWCYIVKPKKRLGRGNKITMVFHMGDGITTEREHRIVSFTEDVVVIDEMFGPNDEYRTFCRDTGKCLNDTNNFGAFRTIKI